jgi:hypothetical protein
MLRTHVFEVDAKGLICRDTEVSVPLNDTVAVIQVQFAEHVGLAWTDNWALYLRERPLHPATPVDQLNLKPESFLIAREALAPVRAPPFVSPDDLFPLPPLPSSSA